MIHSGIQIIKFDERWIEEFKSIKQVISKSLNDLIIGIEQVGSTSVQGLGAKIQSLYLELSGPLLEKYLF